MEDVLVKLLESMMDEMVFNELRTVEQLGYSVGTSVLIENSVIGFIIYAESNSKGPNYLDNRIENFLQTTWINFINNLSEDDFFSYEEGLYTSFESEPIELYDQGLFYFNKIVQGDSVWNSDDILGEKLETVTLDNFKLFSQTYITNTATRRRLSSHRVGTLTGETEIAFTQSEINDIDSFKAQSNFYPNPSQSDPNINPDMYNSPAPTNAFFIFVSSWWIGLIIGPFLVIIIVLLVAIYLRKVDSEDYQLFI
jgi:secreted Zn-dependent insulinase-like peptidase